jgi:hypothetical protein
MQSGSLLEHSIATVVDCRRDLRQDLLEQRCVLLLASHASVRKLDWLRKWQLVFVRKDELLEERQLRVIYRDIVVSILSNMVRRGNLHFYRIARSYSKTLWRTTSSSRKPATAMSSAARPLAFQPLP